MTFDFSSGHTISRMPLPACARQLKQFDGRTCDVEQNASPRCRIIRCVDGGLTHMPLTEVVLALIVVGVLLWLVNTYIPMARSIKSILNAVVVIAVVVWLLNAFGLLQSLTNIRIG
jgi:hypothetical protein